MTMSELNKINVSAQYRASVVVPLPERFAKRLTEARDAYINAVKDLRVFPAWSLQEVHSMPGADEALGDALDRGKALLRKHSKSINVDSATAGFHGLDCAIVSIRWGD